MGACLVDDVLMVELETLITVLREMYLGSKVLRSGLCFSFVFFFGWEN